MNKEETIEYMRKWRKNNKEKLKEYSKKYRENNSEILKEGNKDRYKKYMKNNEQWKLYQQTYRKENKDKIAQWRKENKDKIAQWRKENKDKIAQWREENKYKCRECMEEKRFGGNRKKVLLRDNFECVICGISNEEHKKKFNRNITIDHIDGNGRNSKKPNNDMGNLRTLCLSCHGSIDGKRGIGIPRHRKKNIISNIMEVNNENE